ncbi:MAG TPA: penicillin-binding protein [Gammaproteobacteria bacterium]|nr:penicillin-binding protein [Gammaproteobacteria bacterium]
MKDLYLRPRQSWLRRLFKTGRRRTSRIKAPTSGLMRDSVSIPRLAHRRPLRHVQWVVIVLLPWLFAALLWPANPDPQGYAEKLTPGLDAAALHTTISPLFARLQFPTNLQLTTRYGTTEAHIYYNFDPILQSRIDDLLTRYKPDYAAVVAMDAVTGHILAMASYQRDAQDDTNLALQSGYPAASLFKIITASAAIEAGLVNADTPVTYNGRSTTLYRKQVLRPRNNRWTRRLSLKRAFSESVNTVFARLGLLTVGAEKLKKMASRYGFGETLAGDFLVPQSPIKSDLDSDWSVAELASGFNRETRISPLHAALLSATIANDGKAMAPQVINTITSASGTLLYSARPQEIQQVISAKTARELRKMMQETIRRGTARQWFRRFRKKTLKGLEVGGKTGSLIGFSPRGSTDWFTGYGILGQDRIAIAAVTVNRKKWTVKSSYLVRQLLQAHFSNKAKPVVKDTTTMTGADPVLPVRHRSTS